MQREEAFRKISSNHLGERFRAAVALAKVALPEDLTFLLRLRNAEKDTYVRSRLSAAISIVAVSRDLQVGASAVEAAASEDAVLHRTQAIEEVSGMLLHEIGSKLGLVASNCRREVPDYDKSRTAVHVKNLQSIFDAIAQLRSAANPAGYGEFDLADLLYECQDVEADGSPDALFAFQGRRPALVYSSRHLVRLAVCNGLRNAIEAANSLVREESEEAALVVVAWGSTDQEYWISIIDNGPGFAQGVASLFFQMGGTTKKNHLGFGLAIARQALDTLNGTVTLENSATGGAKFEMRWKKINEDTDRRRQP